MSQTKQMSFVEAITNTLVGLALAFAVNAALMHWTGVTATATQNFLIVSGHTVVSVVRSYLIRRAFNSEPWHRWRAWFALRKKRLLCKHKEGKVLNIAWDGETIVECACCGKVIRIPL